MLSLHAAHGQTSHSPVRLVGDGAEIGIDVWNYVFENYVFEYSKIVSGKAATFAQIA